MSRVTISMKAAQAILGDLRGDRKFTDVEPSWAYDELRHAMEPKRKPPDAAGIALARELKRRANATRRAVGLPPLKSKRKPSAWESQAKAARSIAKAQKREHRASIREECVQRSGGRCENPDCKREASQHYPNHWDHFFGRARAESLETTWMLCPDCDYLKTVNDPSASVWLDRFARHAREYAVRNPFRRAKYLKAAERAEERRAFVETRSMLGAGLKRSVALKSGPV